MEFTDIFFFITGEEKKRSNFHRKEDILKYSAEHVLNFSAKNKVINHLLINQISRTISKGRW